MFTLFSRVVRPSEVQASIPLSLLGERGLRPGMAGLYPDQLGQMNAAEVATLLQISRETGLLYITRVTWVSFEGETFLLIQA